MLKSRQPSVMGVDQLGLGIGFRLQLTWYHGSAWHPSVRNGANQIPWLLIVRVNSRVQVRIALGYHGLQSVRVSSRV